MAGKAHQINNETLKQLREFRQELDRAGIDVAVISSDFGKDYHDELVHLLQLSERVSTAIEPHPLHPDALHNRWSTLAAEIRQHGITVE